MQVKKEGTDKRKHKNLINVRKNVNLQCFYSKPNPNQMVFGFSLPLSGNNVNHRFTTKK